MFGERETEENQEIFFYRVATVIWSSSRIILFWENGLEKFWCCLDRDFVHGEICFLGK